MTCEIAKDLIPLCADNVASDDTIEAVNAHIEVCTECRKFYNECKGMSKKLSSDKKLKAVMAEACPDIPNLDSEFASISAKLKKRRIRNTLITAGVLLGVVAYVAADIAFAVKRHKDD